MIGRRLSPVGNRILAEYELGAGRSCFHIYEPYTQRLCTAFAANSVGSDQELTFRCISWVRHVDNGSQGEDNVMATHIRK